MLYKWWKWTPTSRFPIVKFGCIVIELYCSNEKLRASNSEYSKLELADELSLNANDHFTPDSQSSLRRESTDGLPFWLDWWSTHLSRCPKPQPQPAPNHCWQNFLWSLTGGSFLCREVVWRVLLSQKLLLMVHYFLDTLLNQIRSFLKGQLPSLMNSYPRKCKKIPIVVNRVASLTLSLSHKQIWTFNTECWNNNNLLITPCGGEACNHKVVLPFLSQNLLHIWIMHMYNCWTN